MVKVSAIITTFNRAKFLKKAIKSVLGQTYGDFELIILDNSSSDDTEATVRSFADKRIRYIKHRPLGIAESRNLGIGEAQGEFVAFLDDDDEWLPNKLSAELKIFEKSDNNSGLVYGGFILINDKGKEFGRHRAILRGRILKDLLWQRNPFCGSASNPMLRKSAIKAVGGYDERFKTGEDVELYMRLADKYAIDFTDEFVVKITKHSGTRLGDKLQDAAELEAFLLERWKEVFEKDRKLKVFYLQRVGGKLCRIGKNYDGRKYILRALGADPLGLQVYAQFILSFLGKDFYQKVHGLYKKYLSHF